jgi:hypothetical protein
LDHGLLLGELVILLQIIQNTEREHCLEKLGQKLRDGVVTVLKASHPIITDGFVREKTLFSGISIRTKEGR